MAQGEALRWRVAAGVQVGDDVCLGESITHGGNKWADSKYTVDRESTGLTVGF